MAEFSEVMRQWRRMCKAYTTDDESCCAGCPIMGLKYSEYGCDAVFSDWAKSADWEEVEAIIKTWAAEHPEPVYPTFREWLISIGVIDQMSTHSVIAAILAMTPIPADIAQKLGIEEVNRGT